MEETLVSVLEAVKEPTEEELAQVEVIEEKELGNDSLFSLLCKVCNHRINLLTCRYPNGNVECPKCKSLN